MTSEKRIPGPRLKRLRLVLTSEHGEQINI